MIEQMVAEMGKRWAEIARRLRGRSDNAVKNWWIGGMNRRRRSNNHRRAEFEVRTQSHPGYSRMQGLPMPTAQFPLPAYPVSNQQFSIPSHQVAQQYYGSQFFHPNPPHVPAPARLPSNGPPIRSHMLVETPLQSPSSFSQISVDGAPSLVSDSSSLSQRSPHHGASPVELPPLSRAERRPSSTPMIQLGVPGAFFPESDCHASNLASARLSDAVKQPRMYQESYPMQQFAQAPHYLPSQPHQQPSLQQMQRQQIPQQYQVTNMPTARSTNYPTHTNLQTAIASPVHLPSISNIASSPHETALQSSQVDAGFPNLRCTPMPSVLTPDGSPKDKMSLSNLTH